MTPFTWLTFAVACFESAGKTLGGTGWPGADATRPSRTNPALRTVVRIDAPDASGHWPSSLAEVRRPFAAHQAGDKPHALGAAKARHPATRRERETARSGITRI